MKQADLKDGRIFRSDRRPAAGKRKQTRHTLKNPSIPRLETFITTLINAKIEAHQLDYCELTYRDLTKIKESFVQILAGYYHSRIEYPDQAEENKDKAEKPEREKSERAEAAEKALRKAEKAERAAKEDSTEKA